MRFEVNRNSTPKFKNGLRTTCDMSDCFGSKLMQMGEMFPDTYAVVDIWASRPPLVRFIESKMLVDAHIVAEIYAEPKSNETFCMTLFVSIGRMKVSNSLDLTISYILLFSLIHRPNLPPTLMAAS